MKGNVLILGATSDMAQATARKMAEQGYSVYLAARQPQRLETFAQDIRIRYSVEVKVLQFDARQFSTHPQFWQSLPEVPVISMVFFGYLGDQATAAADWNETLTILETNYIGAVSILNCIANTYEAQGKGVIVGVSSVAGERGRQSNYTYGSAKAGFTAYLSGLRNRLYKSGVHVITVKPGFVATQMTAHLELPAALTATPEQVAAAISKAVRKQHDVIYVLPAWRLIMKNIKLIPEFVFKRMNL